MSSPIGHGLFGLAIGIATDRTVRQRLGWWLFLAFAACAPDLDFVPGLLAGDINRYHQMMGHSFAAALIFGVFAALIYRAWKGRWSVLVGAAGASAYASHLLMDFFTHDRREPYGQMLFWPVSHDYFIAPFYVFDGIHHGRPGDTLTAFLAELFSGANLVAVGIELIVTVPLVLAAYWWRRHQTGNKNPVATGPTD